MLILSAERLALPNDLTVTLAFESVKIMVARALHIGYRVVEARIPPAHGCRRAAGLHAEEIGNTVC